MLGFLGSRSITVHLLRGFLGAAALAGSTANLELAPLAAVGLYLVSFVAFRGCPICWTLGLVVTLRTRLGTLLSSGPVSMNGALGAGA